MSDPSVLFFILLCFDTSDISKAKQNTWVPIFLAQSALHSHRFCTYRVNQPRMENVQGKKIAESSKKQNWNLPCTGNSLHIICTGLGIRSNLETTKYTGGCRQIKCKYYAILHKGLESIHEFWYPQQFWNWSPTENKGWMCPFITLLFIFLVTIFN